MRRLIESGAVRGDRFLQLGLRGYWPEPETLDWMADQHMSSFHMSEIVARGLDAVLDEAFAIALDGCDARVPVRRHRRLRSGPRAGHRHARAGRHDRTATARRGSRICHELPVAGMDVVEVSPPYDHAEITALLGNRVVLEALAGMARRRMDARDGVTWQRTTPLLENRGTEKRD